MSNKDIIFSVKVFIGSLRPHQYGGFSPWGCSDLMDIELIGLSIATSLVNKVQCKPITCFVFSWRSSYIGLLQYSTTSVCWFRPTQFSSFHRERVRKLKTLIRERLENTLHAWRRVLLSSIFVPPDPLGVKKWGDMTPPSSYGCAAPEVLPYHTFTAVLAAALVYCIVRAF